MLRVYLSPYTQEWNIGVGDFGDEEERMNHIRKMNSTKK